jgi:hypothetical protein
VNSESDSCTVNFGASCSPVIGGKFSKNDGKTLLNQASLTIFSIQIAAIWGCTNVQTHPYGDFSPLWIPKGTFRENAAPLRGLKMMAQSDLINAFFFAGPVMLRCLMSLPWQ